MSTATETTSNVQNEKLEQKMMEKIFSDLESGKSYLTQPNEKPEYAMNPQTNKVFRDLNAILTMQFLKDNKCEYPFLMEKDSVMEKWDAEKNRKVPLEEQYKVNPDVRPKYDENNKIIEKGKTVYVAFTRKSAYDQETGKKKKDENGNYLPDLSYATLYAAEDFVKLGKSIPKKDKNGKVLTYKSDIVSETETYKEDKSYRLSKNLEYHAYAGEKVVLHHKGSVIMTREYLMDELYVKNMNLPKELPPFMPNQELAPLYKRKNESGHEILQEKLTEAFRGKMQGNYEGMKLTEQELKAIKDEYLEHPKEFAKMAHYAFKRATGSKSDVDVMDNNYNQKLMNQNQEAQKNVNENVNVNENTNKKGRAR